MSRKHPLALFPIEDEEGYKFYKAHQNIYWPPDELVFVADLADFTLASPQVQHAVRTILAFFLIGDGAVSNNLQSRFIQETVTYEEQLFFIDQAAREAIHAVTYGLATMTFLRTDEAMYKLMEEARTTACVAAKMGFMQRWMESTGSRAARLTAFACAEGIFFCTLFSVIFWFKSKGKFSNFVKLNELISRDESLHCLFAIHLYKRELRGKSEVELREIKAQTLQIVKEALEIEAMFLDYILPEPMDDLDTVNLKCYSRRIGDIILMNMGYEAVYKEANPLAWADGMNAECKTNFFEKRVTAYQSGALSEITNWRKMAGLTNEVSVDAYTDNTSEEF